MPADSDKQPPVLAAVRPHAVSEQLGLYTHEQLAQLGCAEANSPSFYQGQVGYTCSQVQPYTYCD